MVASQLIQSADLDEMVKELDAFLKTAPNVPEELRERISADMREGADDFRRYLPVAGPAASFGFKSDVGYEGYAYSWTQQPGLEAGHDFERFRHARRFHKPTAAAAGKPLMVNSLPCRRISRVLLCCQHGSSAW